MRRETALPRISREGWVPAAPEKRVNKRAMLIPKTSPRPEFIPALPEHALSWLAGKLGPAERKAMREIVQGGDLADVEGRVYLVARVSPTTIDALAAFEAEGEDREFNLCDEEETDCDLGYAQTFGLEGCELDEADMEPDAPGLRRRFIVERQEPGRVHEWHGCRFVDPPSYDATKDQDEMRKTKRQLSTLAAKKRKRVKA